MWYLKEYNPIQAGSIDGADTVPHDAAIERASQSQYRPPHQFKSDPNCTLFVGRLSFDTVESALKKHFEEYGDLASVTIIRNQVTGLSQGYGFITYISDKDAKIAYKNANKSTLDAHVILVDFERGRVMKNWIPRRLGGGFGGKKESGQLRFGARDRPFKPPTLSHLRIPYEQKFSDNWTNHHTEERRRPPSSSHHQRESSDRHRSRSPSSSHHQRESSKRHRSRSPTNSRSRHQKSRRSPSNDSYPHRYRTGSSSHKYCKDDRHRSYRHERNREKSPGRR